MECSYNKCNLKSKTGGYCGGHYAQILRGRNLQPLYNHLSLIERIEQKVEKQENGCLIWKGHVDTGGYPNIKFKGKSYLVHRAYYKELVEDIKSHNTLDHLCRNKLCVNISHLEPVSRSENVRRMQIAKYYEEEIDRLIDFIECLGYDSRTLQKRKDGDDADVFTV